MRSYQDNIIGIIGGMGPYAGLDLFSKLLNETMAVRDQEHLPVALLSYPGQIDDRTDYMLDRRGRDPVPPISDIALQLDRLGARVAGMSCNSAHAPPIFDAVMDTLQRAGSPLRLLNMIEEVIVHIKVTYSSNTPIGILSTNSIFHLGVYSNALAEEGLAPVLPPRTTQESLVHPAIYDPEYGIKAQSTPIHPQAMENLTKAARHLKTKGAEVIILGCTELPLAITQPFFEGLAVIDPTRILARALIRETHPNRLKPYYSATSTT